MTFADSLMTVTESLKARMGEIKTCVKWEATEEPFISVQSEYLEAAPVRALLDEACDKIELQQQEIERLQENNGAWKRSYNLLRALEHRQSEIIERLKSGLQMFGREFEQKADAVKKAKALRYEYTQRSLEEFASYARETLEEIKKLEAAE